MPDHFVPAKDIKAAELAKIMREFAHEQGTLYFEIGRAGIEHVVLPENGLTKPGDIIVGADSHTCTYGAFNCFSTGLGSTDIAAAMALGTTWTRVPESIKFVYYGTLPDTVFGKDLILHTIGLIGVDGALNSAMEFTGPVIDALPLDGRITMANMAIEAGGDTGIFGCDDKTRAFVDAVTDKPYTSYASDADAHYSRVVEIDVTNLRPVVALPHLPSNVHPADKIEDMQIHQVVIGSCTNGRLSDLRQVADVLRGRQIHPMVRCIIIPGSQEVAKQAQKEGLADVFLDAGAIWSTRPAVPAWAVTWASSPRANAASPPRTATSAAAWAIAKPRSFWQARTSPPPARCRTGGVAGGAGLGDLTPLPPLLAGEGEGAVRSPRRPDIDKEQPCNIVDESGNSATTSTPMSSSRHAIY